MVHRAIELDGTCTGEHGVGIGKRKYLYKELGDTTVEFMKMMKRTIDPLNLFNPGKVSTSYTFGRNMQLMLVTTQNEKVYQQNSWQKT